MRTTVISFASTVRIWAIISHSKRGNDAIEVEECGMWDITFQLVLSILDQMYDEVDVGDPLSIPLFPPFLLRPHV